MKSGIWACTARAILLFGLTTFCGLNASPIHAQVSVLTEHNDNERSGANMNETILNTSNVNVNTFGLLYTVPVYRGFRAQPLYVSNVNIDGGVHNVVYVASFNNDVVAFDADSGIKYWTDVFGAAPPTEAGVIETPVIDPSTNTLYLTTYTYPNNTPVYTLHALDITTGAEKFGGPVTISAQCTGSGYDNVNGVITFNAAQEGQRPAITLVNGIIYIAFASFGDVDPYHGWILAYNASTLAQVAVFNTTPNGGEGGIWMGGQGLLADTAGNLYCISANSSESLENSAEDYGESFLKLGLSGNTLSEEDYFKPNNYDYLNDGDIDLGAGGAVAIPGTSYIVGGGKEGIFYLVNTNDMGGLNMNQDQVVEEWQSNNGLWGAPVYWNSTTPTLYVWGIGGPIEAYPFINGLFQTTPSSQGAYTTLDDEPGGVGLSISSNGSTPGTGIVWANATLGEAYNSVPGVLYAFNASNLADELWDSNQDAARDSSGLFARYVPPTVANGKVYLTNASYQVCVYGLLPTSPPVAPTLSATASDGKVALSWNVPPTATGFTISRGLAQAGPFTAIQTALVANNYTDASVTNGTTYYYEICASNEDGTGAESNIVSAMPYDTTQIAVPAASVNINTAIVLTATLTHQATGAPLQGYTLNFSVNGTPIGSETTHSTGIAYQAYTPTTAGPQTVSVTFNGDAGDSTSTGSNTLTVNGIPTTVAVPPVSDVVYTNVVITGTLTDTSTGAPLQGETLNFSVNGTPVGSETTHSTGIAYASYRPQTTGPQTITASFAGDSTHAASSGTGTLTVTTIPTAIAVPSQTDAVNTPITLTGTLTRTDLGTALSGATLTFAVNGTTIGSETTGTDGTASVSYTPPANGTYTVTISYAGSASQAASIGTGTLQVGTTTAIAVPAATATVQTPVVLTATLTCTDTNAPLQGYTLTFSVNGTQIGSETTHSTGIAYQSYTPTTTGPLTVSVAYAGNSTLSPATGTNTLTVNTIPTALSVPAAACDVYMPVVLEGNLSRSDTGGELQGKTLSFSVNGTPIGSGTTYSTGNAFYTYTPTTAGPLTVSVSFAGDANDAAASGTGTLTVSGAPTAISVPAANVEAGTPIVLTATLTRTDTGQAQQGDMLTFSVNGTTIGSETTHSNGTAFQSYTPTAAGPQTVTVTFAGNSTTAPSSGSGTLSVSEIPTGITVDSATGTVGVPLVLEANLTRTDTEAELQGKTLSFTVNGASVGSGTTYSTGNAFVSYTPTKTGPLTISVAFAGDAADAGSSGTGTLNVSGDDDE